MRLVVARSEVTYTGRPNAYLPEATRLLMFNEDGTVMVWSDRDGYRSSR
jgi:RecB family endonuclease NucS